MESYSGTRFADCSYTLSLNHLGYEATLDRCSELFAGRWRIDREDSLIWACLLRALASL